MTPPNHTYTLIPRDVLFFRDARPCDNLRRTPDTFVVGHGGTWPRPDHLYNAVMHTLLGDPDAPKVAFSSIPDLQVRGPFPYKAGTLYLPRPLDWGMICLKMPEGLTDLPPPLRCAFLDREEGKKHYPAWIPLEAYRAYLCGEKLPAIKEEALYTTEHRLGTTLDDTTGASRRMAGKRTGQYGAEYLRLASDVTMVAEVRRAGTEAPPLPSGSAIRLGGQGGVATLLESDLDLPAKLQALPTGTPTRFVRWTLLSPALFPTGWRPSWVRAADGRVMLPVCEAASAVTREVGETRAAYRQRVAAAVPTFATARLIGACLNREPLAFSGWDSRSGATPTLLAVPPGTAYLFECESEDEAKQLQAQLNLRTRSDLGEKGFGLGLASFIPEPKKPFNNPGERS